MNTLTFNDVNFNPVERNGQIWLTSKEIAKALGYKNATSINKLYNANSDEFTDTMSSTTVSVVDGINNSKRRLSIRIFSLRGCHLLAMFARTDIAKQFRKWVLDILDKEVGAPAQLSQLSTTTDRRPLAEAVNMYCAKTGSIHSDVWKLVHQRFALEDVYGMTVEQVSPAVEYIHSLLIQAQSSRLSIGIAKDNMMWRYVGIIKHHEMSMALRDAKDVMANLQKLISDTQNHSNLIFDAFSEQNQLLPMGKVENERVYAQAKAFVAKQDAQKASWFQR